MTETQERLWRTILYFSFFGYPLTTFEVWKWQEGGPIVPYRVVEETLTRLNGVTRQEGFWGIGDVQAQCVDRHDRFLNAVQKYKKLKRVVRYVSRIKAVRGIAICNSLPFHFTEPRSDIDLFIITEPNRVWSTRLHAVLPMMLLRRRPGETKTDPVDMSFFVSSMAQNLSRLKIGEQDPYLAHWVKSLVPVYEKEEGVFRQFAFENDWADEVLPNVPPARRPWRDRRRSWFKVPETIPEFLARLVSRGRFPEDIRSLANKDTRIIVSDQMLKFHKNDRRKEIIEYVEGRMA